MLPFALLVAPGQDANGGPEYADFGNAGTGVSENLCRRGVDGQGGDFGNGIPAG